MSSKRTHKARAVVTGAGSGIGRAFALDLASRSSQVVCADINLEAAQETVNRIEAKGVKALAVRCDVSTEDSVKALSDASVEWFGNPTLVINNAGIGTGSTLVGNGSLGDWRKAIDVNLWGVVYGCHYFMPLLKKNKMVPGGIINVASAAGFAAAPGMGAYSVSKSGVIALSETLAAELSGSNLAASVLCPTFIPTNIFNGALIDEASRKAAQELAAKTGMTAEKTAQLTLDAHDKGRLYVLPQMDSKVYWRIKRYIPTIYPHLAARLVPVSDN